MEQEGEDRDNLVLSSPNDGITTIPPSASTRVEPNVQRDTDKEDDPSPGKECLKRKYSKAWEHYTVEPDALESTFSMGGRILNKWRSVLVPENVEILVTTQNWLNGYDEDIDLPKEK